MVETNRNEQILRWNDLGLDTTGKLGDFLYVSNEFDLKRAFPPYFRVESYTCIILEKGILRGRCDLIDIEAKAPCLSVLFPDQILEFVESDGDVKGYMILMSPKFMKELNIEPDFELLKKFKSHRIVPLNTEGITAMYSYYNMLKRLIHLPRHPYLMETVLNLTRAFLYGTAYFFYPLDAHSKPKRPEKITQTFLQQVRASCRRERYMDFYADKMKLSAKHISNMVKTVTGKTASRWIEDFVALEAKALLSTTDLTVSQISDRLHFPDVSTFGKYFKRVTKMSPNEFRELNS